MRNAAAQHRPWQGPTEARIYTFVGPGRAHQKPPHGLGKGLEDRRSERRKDDRNVAKTDSKHEAIMSTLTYSHDSVAASAAEAATEGRRKTFWRRVFDRMVAAQQRRAEREIAVYLASHGGLFTDDAEREIMRRLSGNARRSV
jgi:hypothetical protein